MEWNFIFFFNSILLGIGLAMDAFSVSVAGGLADRSIRRCQMAGRAGVFAFFQFAMPLVGWLCVHTIVTLFRAFEVFIPWIALILLCYLGGKMIWESLWGGGEEAEHTRMTLGVLVMQGVATSIDALSVGFTIAHYSAPMALVCAAIIAVVTFFICLGGFVLGRTVGARFSGKAEVLGGAILIFIGLEIFLKGVF